MAFSESDYAAAAIDLGVSVTAIKAVTEVESNGETHWPDGRPPILFEAHWFGKLTGYRHNDSHPDISTRAWDRSLYRGGVAEYTRLAKAMELDEAAALQSASWGAFQIMGYHWQTLGYPGVQAFVDDMQTASGQMVAFSRFIRANAAIHDALRRQDWHQFAGHYNGPGQVDAYSSRIAAAYARHASQEGHSTPPDAIRTLRLGDTGEAVAALQRALQAAGEVPGPDDGDFGPRTDTAVRSYQEKRELAVDGVAGPQTLGALGLT